jgi:stage II sporulation protein M
LLSNIREILIRHIRNNSKKYFFLLLSFIIGVSAGAFTVNGLSATQKEEITNYFQGFLQLLDNQKIDSGEIIQVSAIENYKTVIVLWILGITIIGAPFIFLVIGIRGFITGFTSGFIIESLGIKGVIFIIFTIIPKELIVIPSIIALGVNGINFSLSIIKKKSIKQLSKESLKTNFLGYCIVTIILSCIIFSGILVEAYVSPVFTRMIAPIITK